MKRRSGASLRYFLVGTGKYHNATKKEHNAKFLEILRAFRTHNKRVRLMPSARAPQNDKKRRYEFLRITTSELRQKV